MGTHYPEGDGHNVSSAEIAINRESRHGGDVPPAQHADRFKEVQAACLAAAGHPDPNTQLLSFDGVKLKPVKIAIKSTGKVVEVPWDTAVQRIYGGQAELVTE